jgi:hypothetical protein
MKEQQREANRSLDRVTLEWWRHKVSELARQAQLLQKAGVFTFLIHALISVKQLFEEDEPNCRGTISKPELGAGAPLGSWPIPR